VSHRSLALVSGLTLGDYLLWNWSLNGNHVVLALMSGLTLPPLAVAFLWLLALGLARLIARFPRRSPVQAYRSGLHGGRGPEYKASGSATVPDPADQASAPAAPASAAPAAATPASAAPASGTPSGKIAA
jgi:hypothetical protein